MANFVQMRPHYYVDGLLDLIKTINQEKNTNELNMIEIGSYIGESTRIFCNKFNLVYSIDPFIDNYDVNDLACHGPSFNLVYEEFLNNTKSFNNLVHIKQTSDDAIKNKFENIDFVYIDGLHTYDQVKQDILNYKEIINKNGFIGGHDYHTNWVGVMNAVNEIFGKPDFVFKDTSWLIKLK